MLDALITLVAGFSILTYALIFTGVAQMRGRGHTPQVFTVGMVMLPVPWALIVACSHRGKFSLGPVSRP